MDAISTKPILIHGTYNFNIFSNPFIAMFKTLIRLLFMIGSSLAKHCTQEIPTTNRLISRKASGEDLNRLSSMVCL